MADAKGWVLKEQFRFLADTMQTVPDFSPAPAHVRMKVAQGKHNIAGACWSLDKPTLLLFLSYVSHISGQEGWEYHLWVMPQGVLSPARRKRERGKTH